MRRRTLLILLLLALVVGGAAVWRWQAGMRKALESAMTGAATDPATLEEAVGVAMKGIELVQGEKGIELWRLKATWAQLHQNNNIIDVDSPDIIYQMDGGKQLHIVARKGEVQQQAQMMRMWDEVHATHDRHELFAHLMVYNGTSRTMYFPEGARIEGQSLSGNATRLEWDMAADVLRGSDGVSMLLAPRAGGENDQPVSGKATAPQASHKESSQKAAVQKKAVQKAPENKKPAQKAPATTAAQQGTGASKSTKQETRQ